MFYTNNLFHYFLFKKFDIFHCKPFFKLGQIFGILVIKVFYFPNYQLKLFYFLVYLNLPTNFKLNFYFNCYHYFL